MSFYQQTWFAQFFFSSNQWPFILIMFSINPLITKINVFQIYPQKIWKKSHYHFRSLLMCFTDSLIIHFLLKGDYFQITWAKYAVKLFWQRRREEISVLGSRQYKLFTIQEDFLLYQQKQEKYKNVKKKVIKKCISNVVEIHTCQISTV